MAKKKNSLQLTYVGVFVQPNVIFTRILDELMRKFLSSKRYSRERIFEGGTRKQVVEQTKQLFIPNSRYMRDSFLEAEASISSQEELLPMYVLQNNKKIEQSQQKLEKLHSRKPKNVKQAYKIEQSVFYTQYKIKKLTKQRDYYQHHIDNGTVPKMVDGTKKRMELLKKGKITKEEWRESRSDSLYSRGEKSKGGNENMKLTYLEGNLFEIAILNPLSAKRNDRLRFTVRFPEKFVHTIASYLETGESYSIRLKRRNGTYQVHLALEGEITAQPNFSKGVAGMDINPDNLSVTIVHANGNFRTSKVFWIHDVNTVSANKRDFIIQETLYEVMRWIQSFDIDTLVIENLKFLQTNGGKSFKRMASNFSYSSMIKSLVSISFKENIALVEVGAYYSSFIGRVKYQQQYGLSIHQSAAFVLARRGMGFEEKVPKELLSVLFTKEVKKGQKVSDLFKHWKKAKQWFEDTKKDLMELGVYDNSMYFKEILHYQTITVPF
ncbi:MULTISPECIES: hypothetical protein [Bacillus]|uniref:hypothetical protein n=1 Tax=Bacillus TaxID=1386 RepID=UPI00097719DA|nr:hypothetical protein BKK43_12180 [Bacillus cereus]ONG76206.1 hypothetical protein BKK42_28110 [Bacillus cereus]